MVDILEYQDARRADLLARLQASHAVFAEHVGPDVPNATRARLLRRIAGDLAGIYLHLASELLGFEPRSLRSVAVAKQKLKDAGKLDRLTNTAAVLRVADQAMIGANYVSTGAFSDPHARRDLCVLIGMHAMFTGNVASAFEDVAAEVAATEFREHVEALAAELDPIVDAEIAKRASDKIVPLHAAE